MSIRWLVPMAAAICRRLRSWMPCVATYSMAPASSCSLTLESLCTIWYTHCTDWYSVQEIQDGVQGYGRHSGDGGARLVRTSRCGEVARMDANHDPRRAPRSRAAGAGQQRAHQAAED